MDEALYIYHHFYTSLFVYILFCMPFLHLFSILMIFHSCYIYICNKKAIQEEYKNIMAYGSTQYVRMTLKKMAPTLKVHK